MHESDFLVRHGHWVILAVGLILFAMRMRYMLRGKCSGCPHCPCRCKECLQKKENPPK